MAEQTIIINEQIHVEFDAGAWMANIVTSPGNFMSYGPFPTKEAAASWALGTNWVDPNLIV